MYVKESLPEPTFKLKGDKLELIALEVSPSDHARPFVIVCWYRPPTAGVDDTAFENLREILKNLDIIIIIIFIIIDLFKVGNIQNSYKNKS